MRSENLGGKKHKPFSTYPTVVPVEAQTPRLASRLPAEIFRVSQSQSVCTGLRSASAAAGVGYQPPPPPRTGHVFPHSPHHLPTLLCATQSPTQRDPALMRVHTNVSTPPPFSAKPCVLNKKTVCTFQEKIVCTSRIKNLVHALIPKWCT
jgi:hypothetical protein